MQWWHRICLRFSREYWPLPACLLILAHSTRINKSPWAVNDSLAYGFAAAHIQGGTESSWCCQCYQLTYVSSFDTHAFTRSLLLLLFIQLYKWPSRREENDRADYQHWRRSRKCMCLALLIRLQSYPNIHRYQNHFDLMIPGGGVG
jgi:hypothetical protein